jgi:hypothetical protein
MEQQAGTDRRHPEEITCSDQLGTRSSTGTQPGVEGRESQALPPSGRSASPGTASGPTAGE